MIEPPEPVDAAPLQTEAGIAFRRICTQYWSLAPEDRELALAWFLAGWREAKHGDVSPR